MNDWKEFYTLPLRLDEDAEGQLYGHYAWSQQNNMALTFESYVPDKTIKRITKIINTTEDANHDVIKWTAKGVDFYWNGRLYFCVRGWGGLTGTGGLNLSQQEAEKVQDDFVQYILKRLNNE